MRSLFALQFPSVQRRPDFAFYPKTYCLRAMMRLRARSFPSMIATASVSSVVVHEQSSAFYSPLIN